MITSIRAIFKFAAIGLISILILLVIASGSGFLLNRHSVSRASLTINSDREPKACVRQKLPFYKRYNQELAANDYLVYAIASLNAYEDESIQRFVVTSYDKNFQEMSRVERKNFLAIVYYKDGSEPEAIVAIRGTRATSFEDWYANLSWFTGVLPVTNAYDVARTEFIKIRENLLKKRRWQGPEDCCDGTFVGRRLGATYRGRFPVRLGSGL